ncbi:hypothetical protein DF182_28490 [Chitinophaga flava]|uniref:Uncharacterized protein n=2 Tax=Chitinophaga flava TaxID=2259036 RepID=A0A365XXH2_9BACT|nr:hypothetical protein DF182_28490 [Chitinophaga flava]
MLAAACIRLKDKAFEEPCPVMLPIISGYHLFCVVVKIKMPLKSECARKIFGNPLWRAACRSGAEKAVTIYYLVTIAEEEELHVAWWKQLIR